MCDSLSQLFSSVYLSIGQPDDSILSRVELATIVLRRLSFRLEAVRDSEQAEALAKTVEFTLGNNENTKNLTTLAPDFVIPLWAEYKSFSVLANPVWVFLPTVHRAMLAKKRNLGQYVCSFYGGNAREVIIETSLYGNESTSPFSTLQVFYAPTVPFPATESETIDLPDNLVNMVMYDSVVSALPLMMVNAAKQITDNPRLIPMMDAWDRLAAQFTVERGEFEILFEKWRLESRGAHRPRRRGDILANRGGNGTLPMFITSRN